MNNDPLGHHHVVKIHTEGLLKEAFPSFIFSPWDFPATSSWLTWLEEESWTRAQKASHEDVGSPSTKAQCKRYMVPEALISPLLPLFVSHLLFDSISRVLIQAIHFGKTPSSVFLSQALLRGSALAWPNP